MANKSQENIEGIKQGMLVQQQSINSLKELISSQSTLIDKLILGQSEIVKYIRSQNTSLSTDPSRIIEGSLEKFTEVTRTYCTSFWIDYLKDSFHDGNELRYLINLIYNKLNLKYFDTFYLIKLNLLGYSLITR